MKWKKYGHIFVPDGSRDWAMSHAQVPIVKQLDEATLRIYYGTRDVQNRTRISFFDTRADAPEDIIYVHDAPLLPLGEAGFFDDAGVMPSDVITVDNTTYLYYVGWNTGNTSRYRTAIGLATSTDGGASFNKVADGPIMDRTMTDPVSISCQSVMHVGDQWKTWYMSYSKWEARNGQTEPFYEIKYAVSQDGVDWKRPNHTCIPLLEGEGGVACPTVIEENGLHRMWYSTRGSGDYRGQKNESYRIGYAESEDGLTWTRRDAESGIDVSDTGWDGDMIAYPYVIRVNGRLLMFYNGNGFGRSGIGYAEWQDA